LTSAIQQRSTSTPAGPEEPAFALSKAVKQFGLTLAEICQRLQEGYGTEFTASGLSLECGYLLRECMSYALQASCQRPILN